MTRDLARRWFAEGRAESFAGSGSPVVPPAASVCVASGKGGTGKSIVCASLAELLRRRGRALLLDADMGVGNAHILQNVPPEPSLVRVVDGAASVRDTVQACRPGLDLLAAGSGVSRMAALAPAELERIAVGLAEIELHYDFLLVDSAAGVSDQTVDLAAACDVVLIVTTPDLTAMTDAYALLKVLAARRSTARPLLVVNRAGDAQEGERVAERIEVVAAKFLGRPPARGGTLPEDGAARASIAARAPAVSCLPGSALARALGDLAERVCAELRRAPRHGLGRQLTHLLGCELAPVPRRNGKPAPRP